MFYIVSICLFLITLQSFYFPVVGSGFTFLGYFVLFYISAYKGDMKSETLFYSLISIIILCLGNFIILFNGIGFGDFKSQLSVLVMLICFPFILKLFQEYNDRMQKILQLVILCHSAILFIQVLYWGVTREYLDIILFLTDEKSGSLSKKGIMFLGERVTRFSGLFNEPGTYSVVIMSLTFIYYSQLKKINTVIVIASLSCLATMSSFAIVLVLLLIFLTVVTNKKQRINALLILSFIFSIFLYVGGVAAIVKRFSANSEHSGLEFRTQMINYYFSDITNILMGIRILDLPEYFVPNDVGLWFSIVVSQGVMGWLFLLLTLSFVYYKVRRLDVFLILIFILITKLKFTYPLFWILLALLLTLKKNNSDQKE
jgi:hypothetical protein